ncbi:MAG: twin-arginine translocase TatA/TatE family subunit [Bacteroidota bacterium]
MLLTGMLSSMFLFSLGGPEVILIVLVVLLLFGAKKIPELMRGLGKGIREFKDASTEIKKEIDSEVEELKKLDQGLK